MKSLLMILFSLLVTGVFAQGCPPQTHCNFDATNPHIANQPVPPVYGIGFDRSLLEEYEYVRVREDLSIYDAPDGEVVGSTGLGFTFTALKKSMRQRIGSGLARINGCQRKHSKRKSKSPALPG